MSTNDTTHPDAALVLPDSWAATPNRFGIPADRPCYAPGPNAPGNLVEVAHGASSGWHLRFGLPGRIFDVEKNGNDAFWQGLIDGGIIVDAHGHHLPSGVPTHDDLADEGTGVHAIGYKRGFQHALNLVERLGGWRECQDCPR